MSAPRAIATAGIVLAAAVAAVTVTVGSYVSGPILELHADYNSAVTKGQLVARIDPRPFQVKVLQADAGLANAKARVDKSRADLALKQLNFARNQTLRARNLIAQNDLDTARSDFAQAKAQLALDQAGVQQADAELSEARINLDYTNITSPVDGVVVSRSVDVGQTVAASFQTPELFKIAQDLTKMQVNANVSESDIGGVHDGQPALFTVDAYPGRSFEGSVVQVRNAPITVQNVVTYDVVIQVANPDLALKPGMTATVSITTARRDDVLRVPARALRFKPEDAEAGAAAGVPPNSPIGSAVYVLDPNGALQRVEIKLGLRDDRFAEVVAGDVELDQAIVVGLGRTTDKSASAPAASPFMPKRVR
ncbi:MAG: efflux RND transporter periplasmic adaptor subunit [Proteobacteria bacterium]|nr:efflux RND transporter periplasmic adaptor subunit [Pseudomonadota bacterium]